MNKIYQYSVNYQYDDLNRLVSADMDTGLQYHYAYDEVGNLVNIIARHHSEGGVITDETSQPGEGELQEIEEPRWFILRGNNQYGPYTWDDLTGFRAQNLLSKTDLVWSKDMNDWTQVENIKGLF